MSIYNDYEAEEKECLGSLSEEEYLKEYSGFFCLDCNVNTLAIDEYYMVQFSLWREANPSEEGMLCIGCLENRIGRQLTVDDFIEAPVNYFCKFQGTSERLMSRLTDKFTDEKETCTCIWLTNR